MDYESGNWFKDTFMKVRDAIRRWLEGFAFEEGWERGAVRAIGVLVAITGMYFGYISQTGFGVWADLGLGLLISLLGYVLLLIILRFLILLLLKIKIPLVLIVAAGLGILAGYQIWGDRTWLHWIFNISLVVIAALVGIAIYEMRRADWYYFETRKKVLLVTNLVLGAAAVIGLGFLLLTSGKEAQPLPVQVELRIPKISSQDPSLPGTFQVSTLTYGSGTDLRRPYYGAEADLTTKPVNASSFVRYDGLGEKAREFYWGFGVRELPLNGRVWYPEGVGPFPLVLVVHGNHNQVDYSEAGYRYLGLLLASRGMIVVTVDENFLNGGLYGKSNGENDARAWLLLKHLEVWDDWNNDPGSQFYQRVDLDRVALIGHSRGGEAVALAATFSQVSRYPNNAMVTWDFDFNIRSVVSIAPVDEQWKPADHANPLTDINYLVLHGSHDGDVYYFDGIQQYNRVALTDPSAGIFKAAVYIYRANHAQFNSTWGVRDSTGIKGLFLNRKALLSEDEQQQIAKVYISAFLEATLKGQDTYLALFQDYRNAGDWLPQTGYINQYEDFGYQMVADFEEDVNVTTCSVPRCKIGVSGLTRWNETALQFRNKDKQANHAVRVGWSAKGAYYGMRLRNIEWELTRDIVLVFKAADARPPEDATEGLDFSVVLVDRFGNQASIPLSGVIPLQTQFPAEISRLPLWNEAYYKEISEEVFQSYRLPLELFADENPDLIVGALQQIIFEFDQSSSGIVYLDEIGFDTQP